MFELLSSDMWLLHVFAMWESRHYMLVCDGWAHIAKYLAAKVCIVCVFLYIARTIALRFFFNAPYVIR